MGVAVSRDLLLFYYPTTRFLTSELHIKYGVVDPLPLLPAGTSQMGIFSTMEKTLSSQRGEADHGHQGTAPDSPPTALVPDSRVSLVHYIAVR